MVLIFGRCNDGMVFILRRCKDGMVLTLGRCQDGMVLIPREKLRWYGFDSSGDVWSDSGNSGDVRGCVI